MRWPTPEERFWSYVKKSDDPTACWIWTGPLDSHGYGQLWWEGRLTLAHRVMMRLHGHVFKPQECGLHRCDNPPCVNPDHLFIGTRRDNIHDMIAKGRDRKATGDASGARKHRENYPRGENNHNADLTEYDAALIRISVEPGAVLARKYGINKSTANRIKIGKAWAHVRMD